MTHRYSDLQVDEADVRVEVTQVTGESANEQGQPFVVVNDLRSYDGRITLSPRR